ncbi:hypothetical protein [Paenibacillus lutrae]|uniref:Butirosin biosynthesis protein H N-terminal domain-containing protein n=1 Tax=Paenibacillus lutrae TaxID=2078573 RepID=A0A7X3FKV7_9BACL|nr:hypothetical protein [Paenibacillus lutrae]MVP01217.1 hypothetical protein [Paenibacillus lutrae]
MVQPGTDASETNSSIQEQILPLTAPQVYGFLGHAYVLGILQNYEECKPWIYNNYIQLYISQHYIDIKEYRLDFNPDLLIIFGNVPWLEYNRTDKGTLARLGVDIHAFLKDHIDRGFYFFSYVNDFYIPNSISYQEYHFTHDILVYGYNLDKRTYNIAIFDDNRLFSMREISYEVFEQAYFSDTRQDYISLMRKVSPDEYDSFKYDMKLGKYDLDLELMVDMMADYLHGVNTGDRLKLYLNPEPGFYGMNVYKALKDYFSLLLQDQINLDVRQMHILWEHKKMMIARIRYLQELGYLGEEVTSLEAFIKIEKEVFTLRNMLLKFFVSRNTTIIENIIKALDGIHDAEKEAIQDLINQICRDNHLNHAASF